MKMVLTYSDGEQITQDSWRRVQRVIHIDPDASFRSVIEKHFQMPLRNGQPVNVELVVEPEAEAGRE